MIGHLIAVYLSEVLGLLRFVSQMDIKQPHSPTNYESSPLFKKNEMQCAIYLVLCLQTGINSPLDRNEHPPPPCSTRFLLKQCQMLQWEIDVDPEWVKHLRHNPKAPLGTDDLSFSFLP